MTNPWHMARVASRRELPKPKPRKVLAPVGETLSEDTLQLHRVPDWDWACQSCGHHVCSCDPINKGVAKLSAALIADPDYTLFPYRWMKRTDAYPFHPERTIYVHPDTLNAFMKLLADAGVPTVKKEFVL